MLPREQGVPLHPPPPQHHPHPQSLGRDTTGDVSLRAEDTQPPGDQGTKRGDARDFSLLLPDPPPGAGAKLAPCWWLRPPKRPALLRRRGEDAAGRHVGAKHSTQKLHPPLREPRATGPALLLPSKLPPSPCSPCPALWGRGGSGPAWPPPLGESPSGCPACARGEKKGPETPIASPGAAGLWWAPPGQRWVLCPCPTWRWRACGGERSQNPPVSASQRLVWEVTEQNPHGARGATKPCRGAGSASRAGSSERGARTTRLPARAAHWNEGAMGCQSASRAPQPCGDKTRAPRGTQSTEGCSRVTPKAPRVVVPWRRAELANFACPVRAGRAGSWQSLHRGAPQPPHYLLGLHLLQGIAE